MLGALIEGALIEGACADGWRSLARPMSFDLFSLGLLLRIEGSRETSEPYGRRGEAGVESAPPKAENASSSSLRTPFSLKTIVAGP